jgi:hypothetical protein
VREAVWRVPWMALRARFESARRSRTGKSMSLTTVAAPIQPAENAAPALPPSRPERFQRSDFIAAAWFFSSR